MNDFVCEGEEAEEAAETVERAVHSLPTSYPCLGRLLSAVEEKDLCYRAQSGDESARQRMMEGNIKLVMAIARRYNGRSMTYEDIVQEGIIGLLEAIKKYDVSRTNRFSTYATWWIRQAIVRAIEKGDRMIRLPTYGCNAEKKVRLCEQSLSAQLGRTPTVEEIVEQTGFSKSIVRALVHSGSEPLSLDAMVGEDRDNPLTEILRDEEAVDPQFTIMRQAGIESLEDLMKSLKPGERAVMKRRFGLYDGRAWTLKECADNLSLSREGARQIQIRSLKKLRLIVRDRVRTNPELAHSVDLLSP